MRLGRHLLRLIHDIDLVGAGIGLHAHVAADLHAHVVHADRVRLFMGNLDDVGMVVGQRLLAGMASLARDLGGSGFCAFPGDSGFCAFPGDSGFPDGSGVPGSFRGSGFPAHFALQGHGEDLRDEFLPGKLLAVDHVSMGNLAGRNGALHVLLHLVLSYDIPKSCHTPLLLYFEPEFLMPFWIEKQ